MMKNYSHIVTREIEYLWIIENFTDFFKYVKNGDHIKSTRFDVDGRKECRFYLKMCFESEYITCTLEWAQNSCNHMMTGQISIIDKNNEKFKTIEMEIGHNEVDDNELPTLRIKKNQLFSRTFDLFPDNNFKVLCNLKVFVNHNHNICSLNIRKHQSMNDHFKELLNSQSGSDIVFDVDGKEFKAHKLVLMTRSPVFSAMFSHDMIENNSNRVKIEDISWSIFELLLEFIYTDDITTELDLETGMDLLRAASKYQLEGLEALCEIELRDLLTVNNVMDILLMAETHHYTDFVKSIHNFVKIHRSEIQSIIEPEHFSKYPHHVSLFLTKKKK